MRRSFLLFTVCLGIFGLSACSEAEQSQADPTMESAAGSGSTETYAGALDAAGSDPAEIGSLPPIPVALPKMAYAFDYAFRLAADGIAPLQQKHADLCEAKGPYVCQIVSLSQTGEGNGDRGGELTMQVASNQARAFGFELAGAAAAVDAEQVNAAIEGEDLSKQIVDTEAGLRSREALRDRLLEVLETRGGKVSELVEAERSVAQVNAEIDQAKNWLAEMKGRVSYSRVSVHYETAEASSFLSPIRNAFGALGSILGNVIAVLLVLSAVGVPLLLAALGLREAARRLRPSSQEA